MVIQVGGLFPRELYPNTTVAGCIDIFENVWVNVEGTIEQIELECSSKESVLSWTRAQTKDDGNGQSIRTNYDMGITKAALQGNLTAQQVHNQMHLLLLSSTIPYAIKHNLPNLYHENYNLLKYSGGQEYKAHYDGTTYSGRSVSAIIYLNNDYEGGEVEFVNFGIKIKPEPGMMLLFPSNYAYSHIAHPVTAGTKYALVTWIHDQPIKGE